MFCGCRPAKWMKHILARNDQLDSKIKRCKNDQERVFKGIFTSNPSCKTTLQERKFDIDTGIPKKHVFNCFFQKNIDFFPNHLVFFAKNISNIEVSWVLCCISQHLLLHPVGYTKKSVAPFDACCRQVLEQWLESFNSDLDRKLSWNTGEDREDRQTKKTRYLSVIQGL